MKFVWPALLGIFRAAYLTYSVWCLLLPVALLGWCMALWSGYGTQFPWLRQAGWAALAVFAALVLYAITLVYIRRDRANPRPLPQASGANPWQTGFLAWFGTLKWFSNRSGGAAVTLHWPSAYLVENPSGNRIGGPQMRAVLAALQPGDILLRGYHGYLDGEFIRRSSLSAHGGFRPGWFTHVALYAGDLSGADRTSVNPLFANDPGYFSEGPQRVIHSMAKGVHTEDILTFLRCDYLAVLRLPEELRSIPQATSPSIKPHEPPTPSDPLCAAMASALQQGQAVTRASVVQAARQAALEKIGEAYDFDCSDTTAFHRFSCAELLYYCLRGVLRAVPLQPRPHALYPFAPHATWLRVLERKTITPDDYYDLVHGGHLTCVWEDATSQKVHAQQQATP